MSYVMNAVFRAKDEISPYLKIIGDNGHRVIAGLEEEFIKANSAMSQTSKSASDFSSHLSIISDEYTIVTSGSKQFTTAIFGESEEIRKNAQLLQMKADVAERGATSARMHYEEILKQIETEGEASEALKNSAAEALKEAENLEKCAEARRKEADAAEQSYLAISDNKQAVMDISMAEDKLAESLKQTAQAEEKAAEAIAKTETAMVDTAKTATKTANSFSELSGNTGNIAAQSRLLSNALLNESERLERAAEKARRKADSDSQAAKSAKEFYEGLKKQVMESDNVTDSLKEQAVQALKTSESLDKVAKKSEEKAKAMEKAVDAAKSNASVAEEAARAEEQMYEAANKTVSVEQQAAEAFEKTAKKIDENALNMEKAVTAARSNASAVEEAAKAEEQMYEAANKMTSTESQIIGFLNKTEKETEEYTKAMNEASDESAKLGVKGESTAQLLESAFMALGVERALSKIADGFISCSGSAIEFESAITGVYKTVDGTDVQLEKISKDIKDMAIEIPSTTTEIAAVAESAGQLGIATNDITDFTKVMINLGEATNLSSDEAASSLAKFANITGMSASDYENLGSTIVALGNNFATTEADIVAMSTRMASAGTLAGLTESDILALATSMSSVGIEAEAGGSAMSKLLTDIQVAVETGNDSLNDFASVADMTVEQFSDLFENRAVDALDAFIGGLNDVERNGQTATVILENMGITEVALSNAVKSLASNNEGMSSAVRLASDAWLENTALAQEVGTRYGTLESRLTIAKNAANNLKIAIGDSLNPVVGKLADVGTDAMVWLTDFCDEHQALVTTLAGSVAALGTAAGGVTAVATAAKAAKSAMEAFNMTLSAGKMLGIGIGIAAVGAAIGSLAYAFSTAEDEVEDYNGTLEQCKNELDSTATAYENVCNMYGANYEAAQNLKTELDMLNAQYQKGGGFAEDYAQKLSETKEAFASLKSEYNEKIAAVDDSWQNGMVAVAQLDALSKKAQITNSDLDLMSNYADYLNDTFNCDIRVNYDTGELINFDPTNDDSIMEKIAEENRKQATMEYVTSTDFQSEYFEQFNDFLKLQEKVENWESKQRSIKTSGLSWINPSEKNNENGISNFFSSGYVNLSDTPTKEIEGLKNELKQAEDDLIEIEKEIFTSYQSIGLDEEAAKSYISNLKEVAVSFGVIKNSAEEATEAMTPEKAISDAWKTKEDEINELAKAYDEAYIAIRADLDNMFGLFEEASMNLENALSFDDAIGNIESQINYFDQYEEALSKLSNMGIDNNILNQLDPEQAAAFADELSELEKIDPSKAEEKILKLNDSFEKLSDAKDTVAEKMLDVEEEFKKKFDDIKDDLEDAIEGMELEKEAADSAKLTMDGYISQLRSGGNTAVLEAESIKNRINSALSGGISSVVANAAPSVFEFASNIKGYASGTACAEPGLKLVGENGPELISFRGGETVYNADETKSMIHDYADKPLYIPPVESTITRQIEKVSETASRKEIAINVNGSGSVKVTGGMSKEDVLEVMWDYFKPVLASIIEQETFEEGEGSYEY